MRLLRNFLFSANKNGVCFSLLALTSCFVYVHPIPVIDRIHTILEGASRCINDENNPV